jgi:malonyl-CoA O-methyltransferase
MSIAQAFAAAAADYEQHAELQLQVATHLLLRVQERLADTPPRRILEVGCGTGMLSRQLLATWPGAELLCCDVAPAMVATCREQLPAASYCVADGEALPCPGPFDLIISSMTVQWFRHPAATLADWRQRLAATGCLAVALPVAGSLASWEKTLHRLNLPCGLQPFPELAALAAGLTGAYSSYDVQAQEKNVLALLRHMRGIGGATPRPGYRPLSAGQLRRAMAACTAGGEPLVWRIGEVIT